MLVLFQFDGGRGASADALADVLAVLGRQPGFRWGSVGRSPDDPAQWLMATLWADTGSMRRGVGSSDAKIALGPLQAAMIPGTGVYEVLVERSPEVTTASPSDRAPDAGTAALEQ